MSDERNDPVPGGAPPGGRKGGGERRAPGGRPGRGTRPSNPERPCLNCGDPTPGEYCPSCGQRKVDVQVSLRTLFMDVLEDQFILDRRLPRTLGALLFRPGHLTVEHVNGRIVRYIHPFRLYLVSSILFFLLLSFFSLEAVRRALEDEDMVVMSQESGAALDEALAELRVELADTTIDEDAAEELRETEAELLGRRREFRLDSLAQRMDELGGALARLEGVTSDSAIPATVREAVAANRPAIQRQLEVAGEQRQALEADSLGVAAGARRGSSDQNRPLREVFGWDEDSPPSIDLGFLPAAADTALADQVERIGEMTAPEAAETLLSTFFSYVPTLMFILLPLFGAVLKLLYIRRRRFYAEHFVFLLHVHSMVFLLAAVMLLIRQHVPAILEVALVGWILVYIYLAMKRVYGQSWLKTFIKYWTLGWMYFWILTLAIPVAFLATLLLF